MRPKSEAQRPAARALWLFSTLNYLIQNGIKSLSGFFGRAYLPIENTLDGKRPRLVHGPRAGPVSVRRLMMHEAPPELRCLTVCQDKRIDSARWLLSGPASWWPRWQPERRRAPGVSKVRFNFCRRSSQS